MVTLNFSIKLYSSTSQWVNDGGRPRGRRAQLAMEGLGRRTGSFRSAVITVGKDRTYNNDKSIDPIRKQRWKRFGLRPNWHTNGKGDRGPFACASPEARETKEEPSKCFNVRFQRAGMVVRPIDKESKEEIASVVRLQSDGFHTPNPIPVLDSTFKRFFAAEVLSEMNKKIKYNPADRFVCLVAVDEVSNSVIGVVDVSYLDEKEVLNILGPGTDGFVYIASMTVHALWRRRGVALALLEAAKLVAREWNEGAAYLHVYQDNAAAIDLYKKHGFEIIFQDPSWLTMVGVRPRYLMRKGYT